MNTGRIIWLIAALLLLAGITCGAASSSSAAPEPASGSSRLAAAQKEGALLIYAAIGRTTGGLLVTEFEKQHPGIKVYLLEMDSAEVFNRFMSDLGARRPSADLLWSRNIDLQAALLKDGYARKYRSPESGRILPWANLDDYAYATAYEPVAMVYNRNIFKGNDYPASHAALLKASSEPQLKGKIATCDPELNNTAFTLLTHDQRNGSFWNLARGFGNSGLQLYPEYSSLLDKISSGEALFGYNVPAGAAFTRSQADPAIGYYFPVDYTLALLQIALITRGGTHPNAAMLWIDFILSRSGQSIIASGSDLFPIRSDADSGPITRGAVTPPGGRAFKPILPGDDVSRYNGTGLRRGFLLRWKQALKLVK